MKVQVKERVVFEQWVLQPQLPSDLLEAGEWTQGAIQTNGIGCALVWIERSEGCGSGFEKYARGFDRFLGGQYTYAHDVIKFNDAPGRTKQEVVDKMREYEVFAGLR